MENLHIEVEQCRSIFKCNNYPVDITDQCIKKFLDKLYVSKQIAPTVPKKELFIVLTFLGNVSMKLRTCLYKSVSKTLPQYNMKVIFQLKIDWVICLNLKTRFPYIIAPILFTHFSVVTAILCVVTKLNVILKLELVSM